MEGGVDYRKDNVASDPRHSFLEETGRADCKIRLVPLSLRMGTRQMTHNLAGHLNKSLAIIK